MPRIPYRYTMARNCNNHMEKQKFHFGIIGCGAIAGIHAQAIEAMEDAQLEAVCDSDPNRAKAFAQSHDCRWHCTPEELVADPMVDIVCICVPSGLHAQYAVIAAEAGKHIVVEKPMAITRQQLDAVEQAVTKSGVKLAVISQLRFMASVQRLKSAIEKGELGKIYMADCRMRYYRSQEYYTKGGWRGTWALDGGGALMNQGIHGIDLVQHLMGGVKTVYAQCRTLGRNIETEDTANLLVEYHCGAMGVIQGTTLANPGEPRTITISGEKGTVVLQEDTIVSWDVEGQPAETGETDVDSCRDPMSFSYSFHQTQLEDLLDAIRLDRRPFVDEKEGRKGVEIILAAYESERTGEKQLLKR